MPCYKPLKAFYGPNGPTFNKSDSFGLRFQVELPCRRCIGCRLEKAKEWALRCSHEAQMHGPGNSVFVTLTYHPDHLPQDASLDQNDPTHFQKFIRALRKKTKRKIRYFMCGEYGNICAAHGGYVDEPVENVAPCKTCRTGRPHYHAILFGIDFSDKYLWYRRNGNLYYRSPLLESTWTKGNSEISDVTFQSAGYVARYSLKKQNGEYAKETYAIIDEDTGELLGQRRTPYTSMSLKPGLGESWYRKYAYTDLWPHDYAITPDGRKMPVPSYYRAILEREDPELAEELRKARVEKAKINPDNTEDRLATREFVQTEKAKRLIRSL